LDPRLLELELTEAVLMQDADATLPLLRALKGLGVGIAVDDMALGGSSLTTLTRLPVDTLKIDRSFVRDFEEVRESAAIVAALIALARGLDLRIVAEGVETQGQMTRLFEEGCAVMQGFLFSPAVPGEDFPALVRACGGDTHWRLPSNRSEGAASEPATLLHTSLRRGLVRPTASAAADRGPELVRARSA
jgi:EAL domain-containing protein (putative c-di-GMP-specific phosphodiesterase class I)